MINLIQFTANSINLPIDIVNISQKILDSLPIFPIFHMMIKDHFGKVTCVGVIRINSNKHFNPAER